jgi:3-hydroxybutyryl-CoA dehydrogenase
MSIVQNFKINTVAIVGSGKMGTSLSEYFIERGVPIIWLTRSENRTQVLTKKIKTRLKRYLKLEIISQEEYCRLEENVKVSTEYKMLSEADLVIETVPEQIDIKKTVLSKLFDFLPDHAIVGTNSSSILPTEFSDRDININRLCGLHFFFPVGLTKVVEFVMHKGLSNETIHTIRQFMKDNYFTVVEQNETNALLLNMLTIPLVCKSFVLAHRVGFQMANQLAMSEVFPLGPFALIDHVGLDILLESSQRYMCRKGNMIHDKQSCELFHSFMKLMKKAQEGSDNSIPDKFLSTSHQYPQDFIFWHYNDIRKEKITESEQLEQKDKLLCLLLNTCHYAVEKNYITKELLNDVWIKIMGTDVGIFDLTSNSRIVVKTTEEKVEKAAYQQ